MIASPLISINTLCLPPSGLDAHIAAVARLGEVAISPEIQDFSALSAAQAARLLRDAGLPVALLTHRAFGFVDPEVAAAQRDRLSRTIDLAHSLGASAICLTTGGRGQMPWTEAAARFAAEIAPSVEQARRAGVALGVEPTSHLYADASIVHRLADVVTLARCANVSVGLDLFPCWVDSDIEDAIAAASPLCAFVQVSDYVLGDRGLPCRAVPGDGMMPLERLVGHLLKSGYRGPFDIEVIGPRLEREGHMAGLRRAIAHMTRLIER